MYCYIKKVLLKNRVATRRPVHALSNSRAKTLVTLRLCPAWTYMASEFLVDDQHLNHTQHSASQWAARQCDGDEQSLGTWAIEHYTKSASRTRITSCLRLCAIAGVGGFGAQWCLFFSSIGSPTRSDSIRATHRLTSHHCARARAWARETN
jgi:hypothetical protein